MKEQLIENYLNERSNKNVYSPHCREPLCPRVNDNAVFCYFWVV